MSAEKTAGEKGNSENNYNQLTGKGQDEADDHGQQATSDGGESAPFFYQFVHCGRTVGSEKVGEKDQADHGLAEPIFGTNEAKGDVIEKSDETAHDGEGDAVEAEQAGVAKFLV